MKVYIVEVYERIQYDYYVEEGWKLYGVYSTPDKARKHAVATGKSFKIEPHTIDYCC